jgi:hypothetical protein
MTKRNEFEPHWWRDVLDTTLCGKVCQCLATGTWFSPVASTNKTDRHEITKILLNVALNTIHPNLADKIWWWIANKHIPIASPLFFHSHTHHTKKWYGHFLNKYYSYSTSLFENISCRNYQRAIFTINRFSEEST